jgi:hypothetical protein
MHDGGTVKVTKSGRGRAIVQWFATVANFKLIDPPIPCLPFYPQHDDNKHVDGRVGSRQAGCFPTSWQWQPIDSRP